MLTYTTLFHKKVMHSDYLNETIYNLLDKTFELPKTGFDYNIFNVTQKYIARPDLISLDAYGDTMYADVICKLNGISNPFTLNRGMQLILPTPEHILKFTKDAPLEEKESVLEIESPKPKSKQDTKRKPNEALINDKRFKIDKNSGVIIY